MKKIALFILCLGFATAVQAQQVIYVEPEKPSESAALELTEAQAAEAAKAEAKERLAERNCLRHTGSRLLRAHGSRGRKCAIGSGRVFTREDLESTGGMNIGSALRSLHSGIY